MPAKSAAPDVWGVRWEAAQFPEGVIPPVPPVPVWPEGVPQPTTEPSETPGEPDVIVVPDYTPEQQAQVDHFQTALATYQERAQAAEEAINAALTDDEYWIESLSEFESEQEARATFTVLKQLHLTDKYARNFQLVTAPPRVWTPVE